MFTEPVLDMGIVLSLSLDPPLQWSRELKCEEPYTQP